MDGGAVSATIEVFVQNLINVSKEEISLIQGLEKNADKLRETLGMMKSFMEDAQNKFITDTSVERWLKQLEVASFDADNVLDELNYQFLAKKMKKSIQAAEKKKIPSCFPSFSQYALRVKEINTNFESINDKATKLGLERRFADAPVVQHDAAPETNSFTLDPIFIGRDDDVSEIVEMLTTCQTEQVLSVLPIVGMGGLGKTTLTRIVFHHQSIKTRFRERIWVHAPKVLDSMSLLKEILTTQTSDIRCFESSQVILKKLQEALEEKTFLLVLDDVWNEDRSKWEDFKNSISGISSKKGNTIIVTTRNTEVASIVKFTHPIYELQGLPDDNCWSIIKQKAFGGGDVPRGYETIGKDIAGRCQGLPLAANVVGSVLDGKSEEDWRSIKENWLSDVEEHENNITKILKLSYFHLSSPSLKRCFAYCSIFKKGKEIDKDELIELWMAEGFLQPDDRSDMETEGKKYLNLLLQNSLLQVAGRDGYDNITHYSMHDLVHDLANTVLGSKYYGHESGAVSKERAKYLRTLFYEGETSDINFSDFKSLHVLNLSDGDVEELPSSIKELTHLRYLNVTDTSIITLPDSIGQLYHLQTLRAYRLELPSTLKYLVSLRHLHIADNSKLPAELGMLTSLKTLKHFKVGEEKGHRIVELGNLQKLKGKLTIHNLEKVDGEEEAKKACLFMKPNIIKLGLRWDEWRGEITRNDENVLEGLQPHPNLKMLKVFGFKGARFPSWTLKMAVRDEVNGQGVGLNNLMEIKLSSCSECEEIPMMGHLPHLKALFLYDLTNLKSIGASFYGIDKLCGSNGEEKIVVFPALKRIELSCMRNLKEWVQVEAPREVKAFPSLEYLKMEECPELVSNPRHEFPCLKELYISECDNLVCLPIMSFCNNQNLSKVYICDCNELRELPDGLHTLTSLEELVIDVCRNLKELDTGLPSDTDGFQMTSLIEIQIRNLEGLVRLPSWFFSNSPNLSKLSIWNCSKLRELAEGGLQTLTSLELLTICGCPNLESIAYDSSIGRGGLTSLLELNIDNCSGLKNLPCQMVESCAPSLKRLLLRNLKSLINLPMIIDCLHMPRLKRLTISGVPKLIMTSSGALRSLEWLSLDPDASDSMDSFNSGVDGILKAASQSSSLETFTLRGKEDWKCVPDQIQHLPALKTLWLRNYGMEELPEWFGRLASLQELNLMGCQKLSSVEGMRRLTNLRELMIKGCQKLSSMEGLRHLSNLRELQIRNCPVLKERCGIEEGINNNDNLHHHSQWPNISHIPQISFDFHTIRYNGLTRENFQYLDGA